MTTTRKRRRSQAFHEGEQEGSLEHTNANGVNRTSQADNEEEQDEDPMLKMEREVWESFREQYFEAIELLPLSLHRQYNLLRELDQQADGYVKAILPTIRAYIRRRLALKPPPNDASSESQPALDAPVDVASEPQPGPSTPTLPTPSTPINRPMPPLRLGSIVQKIMRTPIMEPPSRSETPMTPSTPMAIPPERTKVPQTLKEMLSHIAWLAEESYRTSEEKVNLAQACVDSVDRQIRLVDLAMQEQERAIYCSAAFALPRVDVPERYTARPLRVASTPPPWEEVDVPQIILDQSGGGGQQSKSKARSKKGKKKSQPMAMEEQQQQDKKPTPKVMLKLPARPDVEPELFCFCHKGAFGGMVACDGDNCEIEWFHIACVGGKKPKSKTWYCDACRRTR